MLCFQKVLFVSTIRKKLQVIAQRSLRLDCIIENLWKLQANCCTSFCFSRSFVHHFAHWIFKFTQNKCRVHNWTDFAIVCEISVFVFLRPRKIFIFSLIYLLFPSSAWIYTARIIRQNVELLFNWLRLTYRAHSFCRTRNICIFPQKIAIGKLSFVVIWILEYRTALLWGLSENLCCEREGP